MSIAKTTVFYVLIAGLHGGCAAGQSVKSGVLIERVEGRLNGSKPNIQHRRFGRLKAVR